MKRALVTGAAGFVGRHMSAELERRGWWVYGADVTNHPDDDAFEIFRHPSTDRYDLVVHCAARAPHRAAIDGQPAIMPYNAQLDAAMFEWAIRTRQHRVLYLSSSAAYPIDYQNDFTTARTLTEDMIRLDRYNVGTPDGTYGWTKLFGEAMAAAAAAANLAVHIVRPFSGYGADQGTDWPFGAFVDRARRRVDPFPIWGSGHQVRDWIHIDDVVAGALAVVDADERRPVNLCNGIGVSMLDLARMICNAAGYSPTFEPHEEAPAGVAFRLGDPERLFSIYRPRVRLEHGITNAILTGAPA